MKISCLCSTYGRPSMINESVESFLRQDYENKELIILNDDADLVYMFDHPQVTIYNQTDRFKTLGEKRNRCAELATGDALALWDDDDICLSHRLSLSAEYLKKQRFFKPRKAFFMPRNHKDTLSLKPNSFHAQSAYTREFFYEVGMYKHMDKGEDIEFQSRADQIQKPLGTDLEDGEHYYIYKWAHSPSHLSSVGSTARTKREPINGPYEIKPHWKHDYIELTRSK